MKKLIIQTFIFLIFIISNSLSSELILKCGNFSGPYVYINLSKEIGGPAFLQKNKKDLFIYDWAYENVSVTKEKIEYLNTVLGLGYVYRPELKRYNKEVIDRYSGRMYFYEKDQNKPWMLQTWKKSSTAITCRKINKLNFNLVFKTKKDFEIRRSIEHKRKF